MGLEAGRRGLPSLAIEASTHVPFVIQLHPQKVESGPLASSFHPTFCFSQDGGRRTETECRPRSPSSTFPKKTYWLAKSFYYLDLGDEAALGIELRSSNTSGECSSMEAHL